MGRYKFQVGVGGKTWKCVLIRVETAAKPIEIRHVLGWKKLRGMFQCKTAFFNLGWKFPP